MKFRGSSCGEDHVAVHPDPISERNLAIAILRQAWHEAMVDLRGLKEESRKDYRALKRKAIDWIASDEEGFPYWCRLADVDHQAMRQRLTFALRQQRRARNN
ncbi:MAG: hypothetical protein EHM18_02390 [Acidobacteria bacterium]|nr:MAG: hypothetical protein EHM18_02390 [Acidobacteriota bacterium]